MGLYDRDYMRRSEERQASSSSSSEEKLEEMFTGFFRKHPRILPYCGATLVVLVVVAVLVTKFLK